MSKVSVTYRTVGSAALKPEYSLKQNVSTPIINFDRLVNSDSCRQLPIKMRLLNFFEKVAIAIHTDPHRKIALQHILEVSLEPL